MWLLMAMLAPPNRRSDSWQCNRKFDLIGILRVLCVLVVFFVPMADALGSMATISASYSGNTSTICGIVGGGNIRCWNGNGNYSFDLWPGVSFVEIGGGNGVVCGLMEGRRELLCWNARGGGPRLLSNRRVLSNVSVGDTQICGLNANNSGEAYCWRGAAPPAGARFAAVAAGRNFACGIAEANRSVQCWGANNPGNNLGPMNYISAGVDHVCGIGTAGKIECWGRNESGQVAVPEHSAFEFDALALGESHTCARRFNGTVVCWGSVRPGAYPDKEQFETIVAAPGYTCGVARNNFSVLCWGNPTFGNGTTISPLNRTLPRPCESESCPCGLYPDTGTLCAGTGGQICLPCGPPNAPPPPPPPLLPPSAPTPAATPLIVTKKSRAEIAMIAAGSVGAAIGLCAVAWGVYFKFFRRTRRCSGRVCDLEQQQEEEAAAAAAAEPEAEAGEPIGSLSSQPKRQGSRLVRRQRSGPSKRGERPEEFTFPDLAAATGNFSEESKLGSGSFGTVYKGTLTDGRRVAIKRGETRPRSAKKYQENASAFESELRLLSRLHHKHLVALVGYCEEEDERLLVYDYMSNGSLYDHLHKVEEMGPPFDSWAMRIKIALDAARGVEYLHTYAQPPIIHRDIKSSNILLDAAWNAKVSDFGLSLLGPDDESSHLSLMAAGTVGYMDPEYYRMQYLTTKSDVYSFGVVLLEMLTGKKAIHRHDGSGGPRNVVDYALPHIEVDELPRVLDNRLQPPRPYEIEAVMYVGYTAAACVNLEGKDRPSMTEVVGNLERALTFCAQTAVSTSLSRPLHRSWSSHGGGAEEDDFRVTL